MNGFILELVITVLVLNDVVYPQRSLKAFPLLAGAGAWVASLGGGLGAAGGHGYLGVGGWAGSDCA